MLLNYMEETQSVFLRVRSWLLDCRWPSRTCWVQGGRDRRCCYIALFATRILNAGRNAHSKADEEREQVVDQASHFLGSMEPNIS
jgi:hypothetical protein